jgi:hypothetical protein
MKSGANSVLTAMAVLAAVLVIASRYQGYTTDRDFLLRAAVPCDPAADACFMLDCPPDSEGTCDSEPYAKVEVLAREAPACLEEHSCWTFSCAGRSTCLISYCSDATLEDGERCVGEGRPRPD